jgi:hypothetical protein
MKHGLILATALLALAGCKGEVKKDAGAGTAQGEVLPGAASDAMLPLDTVKSQAPLAPKSEGGEAGDAKGAKTGKASAKPSDAASEAAPEVKPETSPSAAETPATN